MKHYFKKNLPFLKFLAKFLFTYLALIILYHFFLDQYDTRRFETDRITNAVSQQAVEMLAFFGYHVKLAPCSGEPCISVLVDGRPIVRVVEGCNAISVMILFTAFIVAFSGSIIRTSSYVMTGILAIYVLNLMRIVLLTMGIISHPEFGEVLHDVVFPLTIYGFVFFLWLLWINKIKDYAKK